MYLYIQYIYILMCIYEFIYIPTRVTTFYPLRCQCGQDNCIFSQWIQLVNLLSDSYADASDPLQQLLCVASSLRQNRSGSVREPLGRLRNQIDQVIELGDEAVDVDGAVVDFLGVFVADRGCEVAEKLDEPAEQVFGVDSVLRRRCAGGGGSGASGSRVACG